MDLQESIRKSSEAAKRTAKAEADALMAKTKKEEIATPEEDIQVNPAAALTTEEDKTETPIVEELPKETQIDESAKSQKSVESKLDNLGTTQQEIQIAIKKLII